MYQIRVGSSLPSSGRREAGDGVDRRQRVWARACAVRSQESIRRFTELRSDGIRPTDQQQQIGIIGQNGGFEKCAIRVAMSRRVVGGIDGDGMLNIRWFSNYRSSGGESVEWWYATSDRVALGSLSRGWGPLAWPAVLEMVWCGKPSRPGTPATAPTPQHVNNTKHKVPKLSPPQPKQAPDCSNMMTNISILLV